MESIKAGKGSVEGCGKVDQADLTDSLGPVNTPITVQPLRNTAEAIEPYAEHKMDKTDMAERKNKNSKVSHTAYSPCAVQGC
jgi:hypothetical protein